MRWVGVLGAAFLLSIAAACELDVGGLAAIDDRDAGGSGAGPVVGGDASAPSIDASADASTAPVDAGAPDAIDASGGGAHDAAPDAPCAMTCNGQCVTSCAGCSAGGALCAATGECGDCSKCTANGVARPIACFSCDANRQHPIGTCEPNDRAAYCLNSVYPSGRHHCACGDYDVSLCPGANQECIDDGQGVAVCVTCGEPGTDGIPCRVGRVPRERRGRSEMHVTHNS